MLSLPSILSEARRYPERWPALRRQYLREREASFPSVAELKAMSRGEQNSWAALWQCEFIPPENAFGPVVESPASVEDPIQKQLRTMLEKLCEGEDSDGRE